MSLDPVTAVLDIGGKLIDRLWPDPAQATQAKLELYKAQQEGIFKEQEQVFELAKAQIDVNKAEATNPNWFISGWRPYIGWICGTGLAYQFLIYPILISQMPKIVQLDMGTLLTLLGGLLGLGSLRTYEKINGVAAK